MTLLEHCDGRASVSAPDTHPSAEAIRTRCETFYILAMLTGCLQIEKIIIIFGLNQKGPKLNLSQIFYGFFS
jgi:hypothetical protein